MATDIYIGTGKADCGEDVSIVFSGGDIKNLSEGMVSSSYEITLPLTATNKKLLKYSHELNCFTEVTDRGYVFRNGFMVLQGKIVVTRYDTLSASILIQGTGWTDHFSDLPLKTLDLSAEDHEYNATNIEASWSGASKFYRYPMIWFARLFSGEVGTTANWLPNDFIPMFRIVDILEKIFYPFTLAGGWLTDVAELYILGKEILAEESYIRDKAFDMKVDASTDNEVNESINAGQTKDINYPEAAVSMFHMVVDEKGCWTVSQRYKVIEDGTHKFTCVWDTNWVAAEAGDITINSQWLALRVYRERNSVTTKLYEEFITYSVADVIKNKTYTREMDFWHLLEDDEVWMTVDMTMNITSISTQNVDIHLDIATQFKLTWDERCLNMGVGMNVSAEEMLPDVSRLDFVKALKETFNLRFMPDLLRQTVYVESYDDTMTTNVKVIEKFDHPTVDVENISSNYYSQIKLKLKCDKGDRAVNDYLSRNDEPYLKEIAPESVYTKKGIDTWENSLFAYTQNGLMFWASAVITVLRMWQEGEYPTGQYFPEYRGNKFLPRLLWWEGLTSGVTWYFNGSAKTQYPKATTVDMTAVYTSNFLKTFHLIDRGKIVKVEVVADVLFMQQFITVVSNINEEGFRVMYELEMNGQKYYGYLNRIEFVGNRALMELIIKK